MFGISYTDIVNKIKTEKSISEEQIESLVKKKLEQYGDLISKDGAIHIVANELRVKVFDDNIPNRVFKVENILPGMNFVNVDAKVVSVGEVRSFKTDKREGRVVNIVVGDETGLVRLVIWDEKYIKVVEEGKIKIEDILRIKNAYSKGSDAFPELHIGSRSLLNINPEGVQVKDPVMQKRHYGLKRIVDLKDNDSVDIIGTIVQVFEPRFYSACKDCGKKVELNDGIFNCGTHGQIVPIEVPILNVFLDDGSDNIRVVMFRDLVGKLIEGDPIKFRENNEAFEEVRSNILGKQLKVSGRVSKNAMFDRFEFMAQDISEVDAQEVADNLLKEIDTKY
ncbi:hypothetical protein J4471_01560 [Candidatus Woesearchaeota archaeon]|nr:hypothetical protein [Candidatus Woesearchaeota archaeon]